MVLKQFKAREDGGLETAPSIAITPYIGRIYFNKTTAQMLGLSTKDRIAFFQDGERPSVWYIKKTDSNALDSFPIRNPHGCKKAMEISSAKLSRAILKSLGINETCRFFISLPSIKHSEGNLWKIQTERPITDK